MMHFKALAAAAMVATLAAPAAFSAEADVAFLAKYAGTYTGSGQLVGANAGNLVCRITFKQSGARLTYNGRCGVDKQGTQSFSGSIQYNDQASRYEARTSGSPLAVGKKSGNGVVFNFEGSTIQGEMASTISLSGGTIKFQFSGTDSKTGGVTKGSVAFKKS